MQKILLLVIILLGIGFIFNKTFNKETEAHPAEIVQETKQLISPPERKQQKSVTQVTESVFVPYWSLQQTEGLETYDSVIYFGISVNKDGVNREDQGFTNMQTFLRATNGEQRYLTVRMLNTETNLEILESKEAQQDIIADVIAVTQEYEFDGVVLDLELSVIPFTDVKENITQFVSNFDKELESQNLVFNITLYGDTYYRNRPYDVKKIGEYVDNVLIMAYDFHKSRGEPGPNFPFAGQKTYGYDFKQMITDFSTDIPVEKLTVIFGKFGYDWPLGSQGKPLTGATAFSLATIENKILPYCATGAIPAKAGILSTEILASAGMTNYTNCTSTRDVESQEMKVTYIDEENYNHTVWFEDEKSVEVKTEYLKEQGIENVSYWTWGYW